MTEKRVGLVIGNNYPEWDTEKQLKFAVADAEKMMEILENKDICEFDEVIYLPDRTSKEVLKEVEKIFKRPDIDLVFIYFSGHGKKDYEDDLCLLLSDTEDDALLSTSLTFEFINKCIRYPSRKSVIVVLDCCYSGSAKLKDRDPDVMDIFKKSSGLGTIILTSTGLMGSPKAKEDEELGHGIFTNYLIEGSEKGYADDGNGRISIDELFNYTSKKMEERGCLQFPKREGRIEGTIFIGKNPLKIRENEYHSKTDNLVKEFGARLPPRILRARYEIT